MQNAIANVINLLLLVALIVFIYATIGMSLFGDIRLEPDVTLDSNDERNLVFESPINDIFSFTHIGNAYMSMWTIAVENWVEPYDLLVKISDVDAIQAPIFILSFVMLLRFVLFKLFAAIMIESFVEQSDVTKPVEEGGSIVTQLMISEFEKCWGNLVKEGNLMLPVHLLPTLLFELDQPLGIRDHPEFTDIIDAMAKQQETEAVDFYNMKLTEYVHKLGISRYVRCVALCMCTWEWHGVEIVTQHVRASAGWDLTYFPFFNTLVFLSFFLPPSFLPSMFTSFTWHTLYRVYVLLWLPRP